MSEICLKVKNIQNLDTQSSSYHIFDYRGGSIGSGNDNVWVINDKNKTISNIQAIINFEEGIFGIRSYDKGSQVFLNDSHSSLPHSYETQIKEGDCIRIGSIEIEIMTPQAFSQEKNKTQSISDLGELKPYDKLDHLEIQPKGVEENFQVIDEQNIDLLKEEKDVLGLDQTISIQASKPSIENDCFISYANLKKMISQKAQELQNQLNSNSSLKLDTQKLKMLDLQLRLEHFSLLDNKEILNLLVLSLLAEALQNPTLQNIYPDFFEKSISEILQECINGNGELLQNTLLNILQMRCKDEGNR